MKIKHVDDGVVRRIRVSQPRRGGKSPPPRRAGALMVAGGDRQIDEIERTFTLRYEW